MSHLQVVICMCCDWGMALHIDNSEELVFLILIGNPRFRDCFLFGHCHYLSNYLAKFKTTRTLLKHLYLKQIACNAQLIMLIQGLAGTTIE